MQNWQGNSLPIAAIDLSPYGIPHGFFFRVKSQLKRLARPMYSNPPNHGARIVANVVGDPTMFGEWKQEMEQMAGRIKNVRQKLYDSLSAKDTSGKDWSFILRQIGMFSYTGLNKAQVTLLPLVLLCRRHTLN